MAGMYDVAAEVAAQTIPDDLRTRVAALEGTISSLLTDVRFTAEAGARTYTPEELTVLGDVLVRLSNVAIDAGEETLAAAERIREEDQLLGDAPEEQEPSVVESPNSLSEELVVEAIATQDVFAVPPPANTKRTRTRAPNRRGAPNPLQSQVEAAPDPDVLKIQQRIEEVVARGTDFGLSSVLVPVFGPGNLPQSCVDKVVAALKRDQRIVFRGKGRNGVVGGIAESKDTPVDPGRIGRFVDFLVDHAVPGVPIPGNKIKKFVKLAGDVLLYDEVGAFYVAVSSDPRISPEEDGTFVVKPTDDNEVFDDTTWYGREEWAAIRRAYPGNVQKTLGNRALHSKRTYQRLTRGKRIVNPSILYESPGGERRVRNAYIRPVRATR
jgi:hypothetical protein